LIEQYPDTLMAKMMSQTWNGAAGDSEKLFIDGDGETFRHVLQFMRRGTVSLPAGKV
jgi:hypothetical protein